MFFYKRGFDFYMKKQFFSIEFKKENNSSAAKTTRGIYDFISTLSMALIAVAIIFIFFFRIATVEGSSMNPTFQDSDKIIITNVSSSYKPLDVVVISRDNAEPLIKRIIAVEGDSINIDFDTGSVQVNGITLDEPYINEPTHLNYSDGFNYPVTVPKGHVFVMGDNRNASLDSRSGQVGFIDVNNIVGKTVLK